MKKTQKPLDMLPTEVMDYIATVWSKELRAASVKEAVDAVLTKEEIASQVWPSLNETEFRRVITTIRIWRDWKFTFVGKPRAPRPPFRAIQLRMLAGYIA